MNENDKKFITSALNGLKTDLQKQMGGLENQIGGLDSRIGGLEGRMDGLETGMVRLDGRMGGLEGRMDGLETGMVRLDGRIDSLEINLDAKIRRNGVLIEDLKDKLQLVSENVSDFNRKMTIVRDDVAEIKDTVIDYPQVRAMVIEHERALNSRA